MEIKLDRKKNHIAASDYKEQTTVIKTTSDFKIGNNVAFNPDIAGVADGT